MGKKHIGIDVGGTSVKTDLFEIDGTLVDKWEVKTRKEEQGKYILEDIAASIKERLADRETELSEIVGAGIGVSGPIIPDSYVEVCVNLSWRGKNPVGELHALLGVLVHAGNDANVTALGEMWQSGGKRHTDIVTATLGTGIGGGVIIDEKIIAGKHGLGGGIDHIHIRDKEAERCNYDGMGCVEQIASITGIAREARGKIAASDKSSALREFGEHVTVKNVLDAAEAGDELAVDVMEAVGYYLDLALSQPALAVDPEIFVTGGGVSKAGQFLIDVVDKHYDRYMVISKNRPIIGLTTLGNDAGIYGAARLTLD